MKDLSTRARSRHASAHAARNPRVELLRVIAISLIALFHTCQPWFEGATVGGWSCSTVTLFFLGCVSLFGSYGNNVFFMISGYFLLPRAMDDATSGEKGYWRRQGAALGRRAARIVLSVVFYALVALAIDAWVVPVEGVGLSDVSWLVEGLEFVWTYLVAVALAPVLGFLLAKAKRPGAWVVSLACVVGALSFYVAFFSQGSSTRSLLEWRKLLSAATYLMAFLVGGTYARSGGASRPARMLYGLLGVTALLEGVGAATGNTALLVSLSFKSTSALAFLLALASVALATRPVSADARSHPALSRFAVEASSSILGFYILQAIFSAPLRSWSLAITMGAFSAAGEPGLWLAAVLVSVVELLVLPAIDRLTRVPLLRRAVR